MSLIVLLIGCLSNPNPVYFKRFIISFKITNPLPTNAAQTKIITYPVVVLFLYLSYNKHRSEVKP